MGDKLKKSKRKRSEDEDHDDLDVVRKATNKKKKSKKDKKRSKVVSVETAHSEEKSDSIAGTSSKKQLEQEKDQPTAKSKALSSESSSNSSSSSVLPFDYKYICAPMVGASELPFRLLCRKYGTQLVYTPMMIASEFASSKEYRAKEFQTTSFDRPLVCHFAANTTKDFAKAAKLVEPYCDAIDLNLGCPQRTAYVGHFGSYLLDPKDRQLVLDIVRAGSEAVSIPIFVKIRLLDTIEESIELVRQLYDAGATLIAVHGRYRASFHRKGPGARDGPALLDQIQILKEKACPPGKLLITNGNTITYDDVVTNLRLTKADGIMSAEGILDNPALYLVRLGSREDTTEVQVKGGAIFNKLKVHAKNPKKQKLLKKLQKIESMKSKSTLSDKEKKKLSKEAKIRSKLKKIEAESADDNGNIDDASGMAYSTTTLDKLYEASDNKVLIAKEYLQLARKYPTMLRSVIFHTRRILKVELTTYQLMEDCISSTSLDDIENVVDKVHNYQSNPGLFKYDIEKAAKEKEALERKKREEGKRKAYEARMMRKAKREGKLDDLEYYLRQGAEIPTLATIDEIRKLDKPQQVQIWKERNHSQHCMVFHLENGDCPRGRTCAFLHSATKSTTTFDEKDEVAG